MTTQRRLSRRLVKVSLKYGDTICAINGKKLDQSADEDENQNFWNMIIQSYASKLNSKKEIVDNKLCHIPTVLKENGHEFVIFDEEIVKEGSKKLELADVGKFRLKQILNKGNCDDRKCKKKERVCDDTNKKNMMDQIKDDFIQPKQKDKVMNKSHDGTNGDCNMQKEKA
ncbi:hypothetical protein Tco_0086442 [Tanacetum coccineum]